MANISGIVSGGTGVITLASSIVTSSTVTASTTVWTVWNSAVADGCWGAWAGPNAITVGCRAAVNYIRPTVDPAVRERQAREFEARRVQAEAEKAAARERAQALLMEHLSDQEKVMLAEKGYFELTSIRPSGERRIYRIHRQWSGNIHRVDPASGRVIDRLCIHPRELVPIEDSMLAQKFMIQGGMVDELERIANHSRYG